MAEEGGTHRTQGVIEEAQSWKESIGDRHPEGEKGAQVTVMSIGRAPDVGSYGQAAVSETGTEGRETVGKETAFWGACWEIG